MWAASRLIWRSSTAGLTPKTSTDRLIVRYEEMHSEPVAVLRGIFDFAGVKDISNESIAAAIEFGQFDNMRKLRKI